MEIADSEAGAERATQVAAVEAAVEVECVAGEAAVAVVTVERSMEDAAVRAAETEAQLQELMQVLIWDDAKHAERVMEDGMSGQYREYAGVYTVEEQCDRG